MFKQDEFQKNRKFIEWTAFKQDEFDKNQKLIDWNFWSNLIPQNHKSVEWTVFNKTNLTNLKAN